MITQAQEEAILKAASLGITTELDKAMSQLKESIRAGMPARDAVEKALRSFEGQYKEVLTTAFSGILQSSVGGAGLVKDLVVSGMSLSTRFHVQAETVAAVVAEVVRRHDEGFASTRKLALEIYEGYGFRDKEVLKVTQHNKELPAYLRSELLRDPSLQGELARFFARMQAERLRTPALKAAYMEYLDAIEKGAGFELLEKKLQTAFHERMRYFANRIAQTELHRAYMGGLSREYMQDKGIAIVKYRLNPTHPIDDICDLLAERDLYGLGPGLYPKELCPVPPVHPFCRCMLAPQHWGLKRKWKLNPNADKEYLQSLDPRIAAKIMGSRAKRDQVFGGGMADDVWNRNQPAMYGIRSMGDVAKGLGIRLDVGMSNAYDIAKKGGKHSGWCEEMEMKSTQELQAGVGSFSEQIKRHKAWIANPAQKVSNWEQRDDRYKSGLLKKWQKDIDRQEEQRAVLQGILKSRKVEHGQ
ncbi:MAG: hypothetical protein RBR42_05020 [Desulfomicrobium sp.]|nr:hypothetical protein [Desulfomicrobium sp.]